MEVFSWAVHAGSWSKRISEKTVSKKKKNCRDFPFATGLCKFTCNTNFLLAIFLYVSILQIVNNIPCWLHEPANIHGTSILYTASDVETWGQDSTHPIKVFFRLQNYCNRFHQPVFFLPCWSKSIFGPVIWISWWMNFGWLNQHHSSCLRCPGVKEEAWHQLVLLLKAANNWWPTNMAMKIGRFWNQNG